MGHRMSMQVWAIRLLTPQDARLSYPLMALRQPSLTLRRWQAILRAAGKSKSTRLLGILNPAGCLLTIIKVKNAEMVVLAEPLPLLGDLAQLLCLKQRARLLEYGA
jgi:hypothetical protein